MPLIAHNVRSGRDTLDSRARARRGRRRGDKTWLLTPDGELTYAQMFARVERAASALRERGVGVGDRVLVTPRNTADYLLSWFALMEVGAIQVPVNPKSSGRGARGVREPGRARR